MEEKGLSMGALLKKSWRVFLKHWFFLITSLIIAGIVAFAPIPLEFMLVKPSPSIIALLELVKTILSVWMFLGLIKIYIALTREQKATYLDIFRSFPMILNFLVAQILIGLLMLATLLVLLLIFIGPIWGYLTYYEQDLEVWFNWFFSLPNPWAYLATTLFFTYIFIFAAPILWIASRFLLMPYFIVDCYEGPIEALKMATRASRGVTWDLFTLIFISLIIGISGFMILGIGVLVAFPIIYLTQAFAYNELIETTPWQN